MKWKMLMLYSEINTNSVLLCATPIVRGEKAIYISIVWYATQAPKLARKLNCLGIKI